MQPPNAAPNAAAANDAGVGVADAPVADADGVFGDVAAALVRAGDGDPLLAIGVTAGAGALLIAIVLWLGRRPRDDGRMQMLRRVVRQMRVGLVFTIGVAGVRVLAPPLLLDHLSPGDATPVRRGLEVATIAGLTWAIIRLVDGVEEGLLARFDMSVEDNLRARQVHTQARVLARSIQVVIFVLGAGAALMTFPAIRQVGAGLLASAGIAGIAVGLAARPMLENIIAGIQIALTQPITLDDVVIVEGEWGRIEEILTTYVVVRIWDDRRLVVPLRHFIDTPFQNWTRRTARLLGTVFVHCDYGVDVDGVREELKRLCEATPLWDKRVAIVQVTEATERTMQLRALVSASDSSKLWDLRVLVREGLIKHLQAQGAVSLPRLRAEVSPADDGALRPGVRPEDAPG